MTAPVDVLSIEVGSTITKVNGFRRDEDAFVAVAQGFAPTSVAEGDVGIGVDAAIADARARYGADLGQPEVFVNSSAAGGLGMTVHGLTASMTARAAREASLGAGAIVKMVTAGALSEFDLTAIAEHRPNIILLAGGVDFGETTTVLHNAQALHALLTSQFDHPVPLVYAGNSALRPHIRKMFGESGIEVITVDNVFPEVDILNIDPLRDVIHDVFGRHIVHAPGMARLGELTDHGILPTPGAVLRGAELFAQAMGDVLVLDVGGATTDVHSVTDGSEAFSALSMDPEPRAKRTVEGDLGVFVNAANIVDAVGDEEWAQRLADLRAMPTTDQEQELTRWLCHRAVDLGVRRHAGTVQDIYTPSGKRQVVRGKDLSGVRWVVATGGALTQVPGSDEALRTVCVGPGRYLLPPVDAQVLIDDSYLFSALGTLAQTYPEEVTATFVRWTQRLVPGAQRLPQHDDSLLGEGEVSPR